MPETVVDDLEFVHVDEEHGEFIVGVASGTHQGMLQAVGKERAVGKIGQAIMKRAMRKHLLGSLAFCNFPIDDHQLFIAAMPTLNRTRRRLQNAP